jgi:Xaa-Pro aminopeptidase
VAIGREEYGARRERIGELLEARGLDAMFVPPSSDLEYLTGVQRDIPPFGNISYAHGWVAGAFVAPGREPLFVLPRMVVDFHLGGVAPAGAVVVREDDDGRALFGEAARSLGSPGRVAIGARAWAETTIELQRALPGVELVEGSSLVNEVRRVKSPAELESMSRACALVREAMSATEPRVEPGVTMGELLEEVEHQLRVRGSRSPSFPTHIFTWGERPLDTGDATVGEPLPEGEAVLFDFGAVVEGYCSDCTRTFATGEISGEAEAGYRLVLEVQEKSVEAVRAGAHGKEVDALGRSEIEAAGHGDHYGHGLGHGVGLEVHEGPNMSPRSKDTLVAGNVVTVEPGIYVPGSFGVRIEDLVVVTGDGCDVLSGLPKSLTVVS